MTLDSTQSDTRMMEMQARARKLVDSRQESGVQRAIADSRMMSWRYLLRLVRTPAAIAGVLLFPIIFLTSFILTFQRLMNAQGIDYVQYLVPTITLQAIFFTAMGAATNLASDIDTGMLQRCRAMPISRVAVLGGLLVAYVVRGVFATLILVLFAHIFGFRFQTGFLSVIGFVALALLFTTTAVAGYAVLACWLRQLELVQALVIVPYAPLLLLSNGFSPTENFPNWLQPFVQFQPVSVTAAAMRSLANGGDLLVPLLGAIAWLVGLLVVFGIWATWLYQRLS